MTYLASIGTIIILGVLYWRMVKREIPQPVGWPQALLPIAIGMLSYPLTVPFSMGYLKALANNPNSLKLSEMNFIQALGRDLILAGGLEEIAKLVIIIVILLIFRKKVKNVYEYILIGACVGIGFALIEEFTYGAADDANIVSTIGRLISVPAHMTFNMVMAEFLGRARLSKLTGKGSAILNYVLALLVPLLIHTLYDVSTAFNPSLMRGEVKGVIIALIGYVCLLVFELVVLLRCKKKTAELCGLSTLAEKAA
ncbi:MAG: PrsW family intramembrane metalloprotease [Verrucomicrobia bacterium]|nr:PrsW family intramembrane metalloprotease [Verrucomicrobiota bacterium]